MIVKSYEVSKIDISRYNFYLIYGRNEGLQKNIINECFLKNSKTQVVLVNNQKELTNFFKKNLISDEIIIGMGAGSISQWMRELEFNL